MRFLIRSGGASPLYSPTLGRMPRGAARGTARIPDAVVLRIMAGLPAFVACLFFAIPGQADEIEPEPTPIEEPAPKAEPEPEPKPEPVVASEKEASEPSWIPSIEVGLETFDYNVETTVVNQINSPSWDGTQNEAERQTMFRFGGELMGPMFENLPGRPRLFAKGGVQIRLFSSDDIFRNGVSIEELQRVNVPPDELQPERDMARYIRSGYNGLILPGEFSGQGAAVNARFQDPSWYAGLGVAFSVPIGINRLLYVKPSVQYSRERIFLSAALTTVDEPVPRLDPSPCGTKAAFPPCIREFFAHRSGDNAWITDHSVGAGLEVSLVPFRTARPIRVSLYAEARFMWLVSGSTTRLADSDGVATYSITRDDFGIKGGGGLRFSWMGFD
jgi:hypothetical protein